MTSSPAPPPSYRVVVADSAEDLARRTAQTIGSALDLVLAQRDQGVGGQLLEVRVLDVARGDHYDRALIGYSDLP